MTNKRKVLGAVLTAGIIASCSAVMSASAGADPAESTYTVTIPAKLTVMNSGWNSIGDISATGSLADGKKLTVSAASKNNWALKSGDNSVAYTLKSASTDTEKTTSWEFTKEQLSEGTVTKPVGIDVEDYSTKPAGSYTDTVTFTAKVENAVTTRTVTWNASDITGENGSSFTKDGITITAGTIIFSSKNFLHGGSFTTASGKFTKIVVTAANEVSGTGWSGSFEETTWEGDASSAVSFSGDIFGSISGLTIVFTIEE